MNENADYIINQKKKETDFTGTGMELLTNMFSLILLKHISALAYTYLENGFWIFSNLFPVRTVNQA